MGRVSVTQPTLAVDPHGAQLAGIENLFASGGNGKVLGAAGTNESSPGPLNSQTLRTE